MGNYELYDVYAAAFCMAYGVDLLGWTSDERGWYTFYFDAVAVRGALEAWNHPESSVNIRAYLTNLRYLRGLMRSAA